MDLSKAPIKPYRKTSEKKVKKVLDIREQYPYKGPYRIVEEHNVQLSYSTVARILKRHQLNREKKNKSKARFTYMSYFNIRRKFRYKHGRTPLEILIEDRKLTKRKAVKLALFYPVILDYLTPLILYFSSLSEFHPIRSDTERNNIF